jgi:hypothetical protein
MSKKEVLNIIVAFCELSSYFAMLSRTVQTKIQVEILKHHILQASSMFLKIGMAYAL